MNAIFTYLLAVIAEKHGVLVDAGVLMSTHEHIVLTDTRGVLPRFLQDLHRLLALSVKVLRKWEGALWDHETRGGAGFAPRCFRTGPISPRGHAY